MADRTLYHRSVDDARRQPSPAQPDPHNWKRDETVARILRRWRELSGDKLTRDNQRRTLIACSGGADSLALAFALSQVPGSCVIAHVRHDIRSPEDTVLDRGLVKSLADRWGVEFEAQELDVRDLAGNLEANARKGRYAILHQLAVKHECRYIATGHHADDQLETLMMHLMRGSGIRGMGGMPPRREYAQLHIIRPMLEIQKQDLVALLRRAGIDWREDATNLDTSHQRNRIRHELVPVLREICPDIATRSAYWTEDINRVRTIIDEQADQIIDIADTGSDGISWSRQSLRQQPDALLGLLPFSLCDKLHDGRGRDSISRETIRAWVRGLKSDSTDPSTHRIGPMVCYIDAHRVRFTDARDEQNDTEDPR